MSPHTSIGSKHSATVALVLLGGSGRVVNSLDFYLTSLKSLGCFLLPVHTLFTIELEDSEFVKFYSVNCTGTVEGP